MDEVSTVLERAVAATNVWTAQDLPMRVDCSRGYTLGDPRTWQCALSEGNVSIPCGGTHVVSTANIGTVAVDDGQRSSATPAHPAAD
jgi:alanyl-tRNA synthetase